MVIISPFSFLSLLATTLLALTQTQTQAQAQLLLTVVNNCPFTIWPAIQPNTGYPVLERGGFKLDSLTHRSFLAPTTFWSGRIWARTGCTYTNGRFNCATGDCRGQVECNGLGGTPPASLAQFILHQGPKDKSTYGVSFVDGFNLPMTVTPHEGQGQCPVVGCKQNLLGICPEALQVRSASPSGYGPVMGCKSGCQAFNTDELCCRGYYNSPHTCKSSRFSELFKKYCPATFTYAYDTPSLMQDCVSPRELKVIFCH